MGKDTEPRLSQKLKKAVIGTEINLADRSIFHRLSLIAFFAWVGLGADGLSSSCYGPAEAFVTLGEHSTLGILVGLMTGVTIFIIALGYTQIIELFPGGGGGYLVASRLLSPHVGMFSGCALLIDYALTITLSIASGADAIFSLLPPQWHFLKMPVAVSGIMVLTLLNLRGVKESVKALVPIFLVFVATHAFAILYTFITHAVDAPVLAGRLADDIRSTHAQLGGAGMIMLLLKAYSMGAGTYTGIEAVSNGLPMLREPRSRTGKRTMAYMAVSLSVTVIGLMCAYAFFNVRLEPGKTLNATLFSALSADWPSGFAGVFITLTLASEALLLFVAAQTGFLDGPRIMANMAIDRWLPTRFAVLSDRLVAQNGILCFSAAAVVLLLLSGGSVSHLIVLYSINVFITFALSQSGMVRHWWQSRKKDRLWKRKLLINGLGLAVTGSILASVIIVKFHDGGWITLAVTSVLAALAILIRRHYKKVGAMLCRLNHLQGHMEKFGLPMEKKEAGRFSRLDHTAVLLVSGYNGIGLRSLLSLLRYHGREFKNLVFIQVGVIDASTFHKAEDLEKVQIRLRDETEKYVALTNRYGFHARGMWAVGTDVVEEIMKLAPALHEEFPRAVFFGGQLVFEKENVVNRLLHNYQSFSLQRGLFRLGVPFELLPVRVNSNMEVHDE